MNRSLRFPLFMKLAAHFWYCILYSMPSHFTYSTFAYMHNKTKWFSHTHTQFAWREYLFFMGNSLNFDMCKLHDGFDFNCSKKCHVFFVLLSAKFMTQFQLFISLHVFLPQFIINLRKMYSFIRFIRFLLIRVFPSLSPFAVMSRQTHVSKLLRKMRNSSGFCSQTNLINEQCCVLVYISSWIFDMTLHLNVIVFSLYRKPILPAYEFNFWLSFWFSIFLRWIWRRESEGQKKTNENGKICLCKSHFHFKRMQFFLVANFFNPVNNCRLTYWQWHRIAHMKKNYCAIFLQFRIMMQHHWGWWRA